ncbi:hypothetical protein MASR2M70_21900 [Bacillota bacterium]
MIDAKLHEVLTTPPDAAFTIVTQGPNEPHIANSWKSYVSITDDGRFLIPVGGMIETEENIKRNSIVMLSITNREVMGKTSKGTGFLIKGSGEFIKGGPDFDAIKKGFPWARAALAVTIESAQQTLLQ